MVIAMTEELATLAAVLGILGAMAMVMFSVLILLFGRDAIIAKVVFWFIFIFWLFDVTAYLFFQL